MLDRNDLPRLSSPFCSRHFNLEIKHVAVFHNLASERFHCGTIDWRTISQEKVLTENDES